MTGVFGHLADAEFNRQTRFGVLDTQVFLQPHLKDGTVLWMGMRWLHIGTEPLPLMEEVGRDARMIVRNGLAGVLEQLGERWYNEPTGREILAGIRSAGASALDSVKNQSAA